MSTGLAAFQQTEWTERNPLTGSWGQAHAACLSLFVINLTALVA